MTIQTSPMRQQECPACHRVSTYYVDEYLHCPAPGCGWGQCWCGRWGVLVWDDYMQTYDCPECAKNGPNQ